MKKEIVDFIKKPERIIEFKELTQIQLTHYRDIDRDKQTLYSLCKFEDNKIIAVYRDNILRVFSSKNELSFQGKTKTYTSNFIEKCLIEKIKNKIHSNFIVDNLDFLARANQVSGLKQT